MLRCPKTAICAEKFAEFQNDRLSISEQARKECEELLVRRVSIGAPPEDCAQNPMHADQDAETDPKAQQEGLITSESEDALTFDAA